MVALPSQNIIHPASCAAEVVKLVAGIADRRVRIPDLEADGGIIGEEVVGQPDTAVGAIQHQRAVGDNRFPLQDAVGIGDQVACVGGKGIAVGQHGGHRRLKRQQTPQCRQHDPPLRRQDAEFESHISFADGFEPLAARLELLVDLDGLLSHHLVRVLGAADEEEIVALGDALVAVGIQAEAEQRGLAFGFFGVRHAGNVKAVGGRVKAGTAKSTATFDWLRHGADAPEIICGRVGRVGEDEVPEGVGAFGRLSGKPTVATVPPSFTVRLAAIGSGANRPTAFNQARSFAASTFTIANAE